MPYQSPHAVKSLVVRNVRSLANCQNQQNCGHSGNSQLPSAMRHVSVPAGERDSTQRVSSVASTIQDQDSTPSSSLNNSGMADITQRVTSTLSATQRRSINTSTPKPGTSSCNTPAPSGTTQTDSTHRIVSSPASDIASTPTLLSGPENQPTLMSNAEARAIITNPLRTWATDKNQRLRQRHLQLQAVSTPWWVVSGSRSIHQSGHSDMMHLVVAMGRLLDLYMWNR